MPPLDRRRSGDGRWRLSSDAFPDASSERPDPLDRLRRWARTARASRRTCPTCRKVRARRSSRRSPRASSRTRSRVDRARLQVARLDQRREDLLAAAPREARRSTPCRRFRREGETRVMMFSALSGRGARYRFRREHEESRRAARQSQRDSRRAFQRQHSRARTAVVLSRPDCFARASIDGSAVVAASEARVPPHVKRRFSRTGRSAGRAR